MAEAARAHVWGNTASYEAYMGRLSRPIAEAVLEWLALSPGLTWLDVGCGTGALTQAILDTADPREVLGVDPPQRYPTRRCPVSVGIDPGRLRPALTVN